MQFSLVPTMKYPTSDLISVIIHATSSRVTMQKNITLRVRAYNLPATFCFFPATPLALDTSSHLFLHNSQTVMTECL